MKKAFIIGVALTSLMAISACTRTQETAAIGAGAGAIIGGVTTGSVQGAVVGGVVGGVAGAQVGQVAGEPNQCYYRASDGTLYKDACPSS
tara:strand:- start:651 stop:920 length:270 start_codon:yes stop_codon:yes gene_type:complete